MTQAIVTKYLGPTSNLGARIKAVGGGRTLTHSWNHARTTEENHKLAAYELAVNRLKWPAWERFDNWTSGYLPDQKSIAHVVII